MVFGALPSIENTLKEATPQTQTKHNNSQVCKIE